MTATVVANAPTRVRLSVARMIVAAVLAVALTVLVLAAEDDDVPIVTAGYEPVAGR